MEASTITFIAITLFTFYLLLKDYKRTRKLWQVIDKKNYANKDFFLYLYLPNTTKYKVIKVNKEVYYHYSLNDKVVS
jgi:hypothetical protein